MVDAKAQMLIEYNGDCSNGIKEKVQSLRFPVVWMFLICVVSGIARKGNSPQASSNQTEKKKSFLIKKIICTHFLGYFHVEQVRNMQNADACHLRAGPKNEIFSFI